MMNFTQIMGTTFRKIILVATAVVWLSNGLFCKVLNLAPRHQLIVSRILGEDYSSTTTKAIGVLESLMAVWILSGIKSRWCAWTQIVVVAIMNILEFILVPDLLLFGQFNALFAFLFIIIIYTHEFGNDKIATGIPKTRS